MHTNHILLHTGEYQSSRGCRSAGQPIAFSWQIISHIYPRILKLSLKIPLNLKMIPCFLLEGGEKKEKKKSIQGGFLPYLREGVWCYLTLLSTHRWKHIAQNIKIILITDNYCVKKKVSNEELPVRTWLCPTDCKRKTGIITAEESSGLQENDAFLFDIF